MFHSIGNVIKGDAGNKDIIEITMYVILSAWTDFHT